VKEEEMMTDQLADKARRAISMYKQIIKTLLLFLLLPGLIAVGQTRRGSVESNQTPERTRAQQRGGAQSSRTITGRVVDESGQPISDATIMALPVGILNMPQGMAMIGQIRPTSTDDQGRFLIENLRPGVYTITPAVPGYVIAPAADESLPPTSYYRPGDIANIRMMRGGVITGRVTTTAGQPIIGVRVRPHRVKDLKSRAVGQDYSELEREWKTDDRGQYRIYGLQPGTYVVNAGGRGIIPFITTAYDSDAPTYHPSSNRETAGEITLHGGEEMSGIDIQYRDNRGYFISGTVTGGAATGAMALNAVVLTEAKSNSFLGQAVAPVGAGPQKFAFDAIADGEYFVTAMSSDYKGGSAPRRVAIQGADVSGIELSIQPFGSIEGRIILEPMAGAAKPEICKGSRPIQAQEAVLFARGDEQKKEQGEPEANPVFSLMPFGTESVADEKSEFKIGMLAAGRYRIETQLPGEDWFLRSITLPPEKAGEQPPDGAKSGISLKAGQRQPGVSITIKEGAGGLRGRIVPAKEGARLPERLRVHMVPAEKESGDETLRYYETAAAADRSYSFTNIAPGKYWIIARRDSSPPRGLNLHNKPRPLAWDAEKRLMLRKEGEAAATVELLPCQRVLDHALRYETARPQENRSDR
jgi:protocatechuate 3,4-dioxygenase beta subunit